VATGDSKEAFSLTGNSSLTIHKPPDGVMPPGFNVSPKLTLNPDTYREW
jgi:hypothetical protein